MIETIGYLELVLYAKGKNLEELWNPEPERSQKNIKEELERLWEESKKVHPKLWNMAEAFFLFPGEVFFLFLALLPALDTAFSAAFDILGGKDGCPTEQMAIDMWRKNHGKEEKIRYDFLYRFFFQTEQVLCLRQVVVRYLTNWWDKTEQVSLKIPKKELCPRAWQMYKKLEKIEGNFCFYGAKGIGKYVCFCMLAQNRGLHPVYLHQEKEIESQLFLAVVFHQAVAISENIEKEKWEAYLPYLSFVVLFYETVPENTDWIQIHFEDLTMEERFLVWQSLGEPFLWAKSVSFRLLSNQYCLTPQEIKRSILYAEQERKLQNLESIGAEEIAYGIQRVLQHHFTSRVTVISCKYDWEDLVLPQKQKSKLSEICSQVEFRHQVLEKWGLEKKMIYGNGITVLFCGHPGTGKTMAAQVLAKGLNMRLCQAELTAVVSKYVGETEKNLQRIFEDAKKSQAVLFFDEADVLFGKRTEVKDAHDKYSNMEAAFLLQEMEKYEGVVILATNFLENIDEAFKRRMKFIVEFPFPNARQREQIWKKSIPEKMPLSSDVDLLFLAENFELSGSNIKNIIYYSAFLAAARGQEVTMESLVKGVQREYEKIGKILSKKEAGIYGHYLEFP